MVERCKLDGRETAISPRQGHDDGTISYDYLAAKGAVPPYLLGVHERTPRGYARVENPIDGAPAPLSLEVHQHEATGQGYEHGSDEEDPCGHLSLGFDDSGGSVI